MWLGSLNRATLGYSCTNPCIIMGVQATAPSAPLGVFAGLAVDCVGNGSGILYGARVSWSPPLTTGGALPLAYFVYSQPSPGGGAGATLVATTNDTEAFAWGLSPNTAEVFAVFVANGAGLLSPRSQWSPPLNVTPSPVLAPQLLNVCDCAVPICMTVVTCNRACCRVLDRCCWLYVGITRIMISW